MNEKMGEGKIQRLALVTLWPSFLVAILAEGFFFSIFDPNELLHIGGDYELHLSPIAVYTLGFFFFWAFCALASMLTYYLAYVPNNPDPPF
jgi:hypothetical protein